MAAKLPLVNGVTMQSIFYGTVRFSLVFRRASEVPIYRIEKNPRLARRQGAYSIVSATALLCAAAIELDRVLRAIDKSLRVVAG